MSGASFYTVIATIIVYSSYNTLDLTTATAHTTLDGGEIIIGSIRWRSELQFCPALVNPLSANIFPAKFEKKVSVLFVVYNHSC